MKKFFLTILVLVPSLTWARMGNDQGNGGDAVFLNGKYYLLDLVEAGAELDPYINMSIQPRDEFLQRLASALPPGFPNELIARKLTEIYNINKMMSLMLMVSIEAYQWKIVNSSLLDVYDENTNLNIPRKNILQLAIRKNSSILVDRNLWQKIDSANKTALVFHEILYALNPLHTPTGFAAAGFQVQYQSSEEARELNGYLFSDFARQGNEGFDRFSWYHMLSDQNYYFGSFRGVSEYRGRLLMNPFIDIKISEEWSNWLGLKDQKDDIQLGRPYPNQQSEGLISDACDFALAQKKPLQVSAHYGSGVSVSLSYFTSPYGSRQYLNVTSSDGETRKILNQKFVEKSSCVAALKQAIDPVAKSMNEDYK